MEEMNWLDRVKGLFSEPKATDFMSEEQSKEKILHKSSRWQMFKIDLQVLENSLSKEYTFLGQEFYKKVKKKHSEKKLKTHVASIGKIQKQILQKQESLKNLENNLLKAWISERKLSTAAAENSDSKVDKRKKTTKKVAAKTAKTAAKVSGKTAGKVSAKTASKVSGKTAGKVAKKTTKKVVKKAEKSTAKKIAVKMVKKSAAKKVVAKMAKKSPAKKQSLVGQTVTKLSKQIIAKSQSAVNAASAASAASATNLQKIVAKKVVGKKSPAKKVVAKKSPAKKVVAKKSPAKKSAAKKG